MQVSMQSALCSRFRKPPPWPSFVVCTQQISSKIPQFLWTQPEFLDGPRFDRHGKKKFAGPKRQKKRKPVLQVGSKAWGIELVTHRRLHSTFDSRVVLVEHAAIHTPHLRDRRRWSMPSDCSNFEDEERAALMYDKLLRCTGYTRRAALTKGTPKNRGIPNKPANQRASYF